MAPLCDINRAMLPAHYVTREFQVIQIHMQIFKY